MRSNLTNLWPGRDDDYATHIEKENVDAQRIQDRSARCNAVCCLHFDSYRPGGSQMFANQGTDVGNDCSGVAGTERSVRSDTGNVYGELWGFRNERGSHGVSSNASGIFGAVRSVGGNAGAPCIFGGSGGNGDHVGQDDFHARARDSTGTDEFCE